MKTSSLLRTLFIFVLGVSFCIVGVDRVAAEFTIFNRGKWIVKCADDTAPNPREMRILVDGTFVAKCSELIIQHKMKRLGAPQIYSVKGTGALRPALPPPGEFGGTFYATGYWDCDPSINLVQHLFITKLNMGLDPDNPKHLRLKGKASNPTSFKAKKFTMRLSGSASETRLTLSYTLVATRSFCIDETRQARSEGFRAARIASNFLSNSIHDSDLARYTDSHATIVCTPLKNNQRLIFEDPLTMGEPELYLAHTATVPRNSPTLIITISKPEFGEFAPQGFVTQSWDPDADNVDLWVNWNAAKPSYSEGETIGKFSFDLRAIAPGIVPCN